MLDLDALVLGPCAAVFGEPVLVEHVGGPPGYQVLAVFDAAYLEQMRGTDSFEPANVTNARPVLGIQESLLQASIEQSDVVTVLRTGQAYWVNEARPDGHGHILLLLNEAPP